jgi:hypothetical protein
VLHNLGSPLLDYIALGILLFVVIVLFYGIIAIHDIPAEIAHQRNHPHEDAIHAAGWVSIFTLHALWPFLWIWAMMYRPERGWGFMTKKEGEEEAAELRSRVEELLQRVIDLESVSGQGRPIRERAAGTLGQGGAESRPEAPGAAVSQTVHRDVGTG